MASILAPTPEIAVDEATHDDSRALIFRVGGRVYACDLTAVRGVVPLGHVTRLPGAPGSIRGLINVRGEIVTVLDAGAYLHGVSAAPNGSVLLIELRGRLAGLAVDVVADVRTVRAEEEYGWLDVCAIVAQLIVIAEEE